ncbi:MAG: ABC transporter ATP-binding protein [Oscillospiraceae bacterium]|nr:ABC transporter ATP-binding protein [Oscillospiraceae bacterium]
MIRISNLSKIYKTKTGIVTALSDVDLHVTKQEFLAVIGKSGSGKSTLMNILGCLTFPTAGSYFLNGNNVLAIKKAELSRIRNREIGFIFQKFNLIEKMTALENVELPLIYAKVPHSERRAIAKSTLCKLGLSERLNHHPSELSGGQQQRVAIARAIAHNPSVILADEPTGNLDPNSTSDTLEILSELNRNGATVVLITHDKNIAARAHRVIEISNGKIILQ